MKQNARMVGEFVLIVVGVLVALTVESALESRKDDQLLGEYLSRIESDISADRSAIVSRIEFFNDVQRFSDEVLVWREMDAPVDRDVLLAAFYAAEIWPFIPNLSTYDDLRNTGNIRLIDDIDLRMGLSAYYNKADTSRNGWNPSEDYRKEDVAFRRVLTYRHSELGVMIYLLTQQAVFADSVLADIAPHN